MNTNGHESKRVEWTSKGNKYGNSFNQIFYSSEPGDDGVNRDYRPGKLHRTKINIEFDVRRRVFEIQEVFHQSIFLPNESELLGSRVQENKQAAKINSNPPWLF